MKKRFIVLIESSTKAQNDGFLEWIRKEKLGWWHWFQNAWLISNSAGTQSAALLRDTVEEHFPNANTLVIELREGEGTWAGFGPDQEEKNMFNWLRKNWRKRADY